MADEVEKTCENCKYEYEDMEGIHCRHCIHNAEEHFEPKEVELSEQEIRAKAIDEFVKTICKKYTEEESKGNYRQYCCNIKQEIVDIAEQLKAGGKNE